MEQQTTIDALVRLLDDEDRHVSTLAMERLLTLDRAADHLVAEHQESHNPVLRGRIHQLGSILRQRRERLHFIDKVRRGAMPLWEGVLEINSQFSVRFRPEQVDRAMDELVELLPRSVEMVGLAEFLQRQNFSYTGEDVLGPDLYLIEDVMVQRVGSPVLLAVLAEHLAMRAGLKLTVVLFKGKHCLIDSNWNLLEPADGWRMGRLKRRDRVHACLDRDIWLTILCQLFLSALLEGRLQAIDRVGAILAQLCGGTIRELPFPLGS